MECGFVLLKHSSSSHGSGSQSQPAFDKETATKIKLLNGVGMKVQVSEWILRVQHTGTFLESKTSLYEDFISVRQVIQVQIYFTNTFHTMQV